MTRREARRRLGSRSTRRRNTNGKGIAGTGGQGKKRTMCRRFPLPANNLAWKVEKILRESV